MILRERKPVFMKLLVGGKKNDVLRDATLH